MSSKLGMPSITLTQARAFWWMRQALGPSPKGRRVIAEVLGDSGWLRTLGGADVYLAARARWPGMTRGELDASVVAGDLRVMPAVRGCIYLVPRSAAADLIAQNGATWRAATTKDLAKIGKTLKAIEAIAPAVRDALAKGPLTTDAIRKAMPKGSIPTFGEAGKKIGLSSPLPLALRLLELDHAIERTLDGGRLDTERYLWALTTTKPRLAKTTAEERLASIVDTFLGFAGPATVANIAAWSGRTQRDVTAALEQLGAVEVTVEELGPAWLRASDAKALTSAPPAKGIRLLAFEDNYLVSHAPLGLVADPRHHKISLDISGSKTRETLGEAKHVLARMIVIDGVIAGLWEVSPRAEAAVWHLFEPATKALTAQVDELAQSTARFLLDEIGHARSFTLDTMELVQKRADRIAKLAAA